MKKEFNLSEKIVVAKNGELEVEGLDYLWLKDVKEFIKLLKELGKHRLENKRDFEMYCEDINKLAGEKLI